jgi:multidrug efflux system membrane fusion protein
VQLEQAEGQLAKDQAALQNARIDLNRYEDLITKNAVSQQILQTQRATVAQARQRSGRIRQTSTARS